MHQCELAFSSENEIVRMLNASAFTPSRRGRQNVIRRDYAQVHNTGLVPLAQGRSSSPSSATHHPIRERSPIPSSSSQETLAPSDSISQISQQVPNILKKTWIKKPRTGPRGDYRSEEHTSELQSLTNLVCRLLLEKKKKKN